MEDQTAERKTQSMLSYDLVNNIGVWIGFGIKIGFWIGSINLSIDEDDGEDFEGAIESGLSDKVEFEKEGLEGEIDIRGRDAKERRLW